MEFPLISRLGLVPIMLATPEPPVHVVIAEKLEKMLESAMKVKGWPDKYLGAPDIWMWTDGNTQAPGVSMHEGIVVGIQEIAPKSCEHEWLVPYKNRTTCKRCGRDGFIKMDVEL